MDMNSQPLSRRPPTEEEARTASAVANALEGCLTPAGLSLRVGENGDGERVELPLPLTRLILDVLRHLGQGDMLRLASYGEDLSTREAAGLLGVSQQFLTKRLDEGEIGSHAVGSRRRIPVSEVLDWRRRNAENRLAAMTELQRLGQAFDADQAAPRQQ